MMKKTMSTIVLSLVMLMLGPPAEARSPGGPGGPPRGDALKHALFAHLYPVELVRTFADEIGLTKEQVARLRKAVTDSHARSEELRWEVGREARRLAELVERGASRKQIMAQIDRVFAVENMLKKVHLGMMLEIRDILTAKQREALDAIKRKHGPGPGSPRRGPGGPPAGPGGPDAPVN